MNAAGLTVPPPGDVLKDTTAPHHQVRVARTFRGWNTRQRLAHRGAQEQMEPAMLFSLRSPKQPFRNEPIPEGCRGKLWRPDPRIESVRITNESVKREMEWLKKALWKFHAYYQEACWFIVTLERQTGPGWHFHITASAIPSGAFIAALRRSWIKHVKATPDEAAQCFHVRKTWKSPEALRNYVSKPFDKNGHDPKPDMAYMGEMGAFQPWCIIGRQAASDREKENAEAEKENTEALHRSLFSPPHNLPVACPQPLHCLIPGDSAPPEMLRLPACSKPPAVLACGASIAPETVSARAASHPAAMGVRIAARYGRRDSLIPPDTEWAIAHIQGLVSAGWQLTAIHDPGPCFPPDTVDALFLIPAGRVRAFEIAAAPPDGFARIVRAS